MCVCVFVCVLISDERTNIIMNRWCSNVSGIIFFEFTVSYSKVRELKDIYYCPEGRLITDNFCDNNLALKRSCLSH